jgi:hypothetical protein
MGGGFCRNFEFYYLFAFNIFKLNSRGCLVIQAQVETWVPKTTSGTDVLLTISEPGF